MVARLATGITARAAALAALLALGGCSHLHWPWHHAPPPPPAPVHALEVSGSATPPQYWQRNTLLIDLSGVSGEGHVVLTPTAGNPWPVRLAFRVRPGAFGALEVRGAAREVLPIDSAGVKPVDLELPPGIYTAGTPQITVSWGAAEAAQP
ncbi:MAG TPA: hypothetical protein VFI86_09080 [Burkholderiales bacterium]|nr:hypothetical protein [Burkholderiales bacterium]